MRCVAVNFEWFLLSPKRFGRFAKRLLTVEPYVVAELHVVGKFPEGPPLMSTDQLANNTGVGIDLAVPGGKNEKRPRSYACIKPASSADGSDVSTYPNVPLSLTSRAARTSPPMAAR